MAPPVSFTIANQLAELQRAAGLIEAFALEHGLPTKAAFELHLALDEWLTNVISYGYEDGDPHTIRVCLQREPAGVALEVEDDGRPFDPLSVAPPDLDRPLEERPIGGLGIHLVRKVMDRLAYERRGDKNIFKMWKGM